MRLSNDRAMALGRDLGFRGRGSSRGGGTRETGDMRRHRRTLMCFSFRAGRASRSESGAYHEREPLLQPVTSRHDLNYSNFGLFLITTGRPNHDLPTVDVFVSFLFIRRVTHVIIRKEQESTGVRFHLRRFAIDGRRSKIGARTFDLGQISDPPVVRRAGGRGGPGGPGGPGGG